MVIHNQDDLRVISSLKKLCEKAGVIYQPRQNIGMDIGALKDLCTGVIHHPEFDYLLWFTDDVMPIRPSFITEFVSKADKGCSAYCISVGGGFPTHIRTVGYCLNKSVVDRLVFKNYITKNDCYGFEYADDLNLYNQVTRMDITPVQVCDKHISPVWDSDKQHDGKLNRGEEQRKNFGFSTSIVSYISPFMNRKQLVRKNWDRSKIKF